MTKFKIILLFTVIQCFALSCCKNYYKELEFESLIPIVESILVSEDSLFINGSTEQAKIIHPKSNTYQSQQEMISLRKIGVSKMYFYSKKEIWFVVSRVQYIHKLSEILIGYCPDKDSNSFSNYQCVVKRDNSWYFAQNDIKMD